MDTKRNIKAFFLSALLFIQAYLVGYPYFEKDAAGFRALYDSCVSLRDGGKFDEAIQGLLKVHDNAKKTQNRSLELASLKQLGILFLNIGNLPESTRCFKEAKFLSIILADEKSFATFETMLKIYEDYNNGKKYRDKGEYTKAVQAYESAISLSRSIKSREHEIKCLRQMSLVYLNSGGLKEYKDLNEQSLGLSRAIHHGLEEARALNNLGIYYWKALEYSKALDNFENALRIVETQSNKSDQDNILHNTGIIYSELGEFNEAIKYLSAALKITQSQSDSESLIKDLLALGITYRRMAFSLDNKDYYDKSMKIYMQTLDMLRTYKDERTEMMVLNSLGNINSDLGKFPVALQYFEQSISKAEALGDKEAVGMILNNIGIVYSNLGQYEVSTGYFQKAINHGQEIQGGQILWEAYLEIANVHRKKGDIENAILNYKNSVAVIEDIRSQIKLEDLKASYLGTDKRLEAYLNLIDLLADRGCLANDGKLLEEAFQYLERAKARAFLDSLEISKIPVSQGVDARLLNREGELMSDISGLYTRLLTAGLNADEKNKIIVRIRDLDSKLEGLKSKIRTSSPAYASLKYPRISTLAEAQNLLDEQTTCLSYALGKNRSWGFALTRNTLKAFPLPPKKDIQMKVSDYLKIITDKDAGGFELGRELYSMLVLPGLDRTTSRIVVIPDDILFLLPFETLITDISRPRWLIESARISYAPSLSSLREIVLKRKARKGGQTKDLLALGSPDFSLGESSQETLPSSGALATIFPSLPFKVEALRFSQSEVEGIASAFKPKKTTLLLGREATEDALKSLPLENYRIIHFATHSLIDDANPARSSVLLTLDRDPAEDGLLQMREVFNLSLRADLVTLSGCRTGLGQFIRGEGIDNLSRAFFYAGASSVLMSLWAVDDEASAYLMARIYAYLRSSRSVEEALQQAQLEIIRSRGTHHPYYWGGFVATGMGDEVLYPDLRLLNLLMLIAALTGIAAILLMFKKKRR